MTIKCTHCGKSLTAQQAGEPCPKCGSMDRNLSVADRGVAVEKATAVKTLARKHFEIEPGMQRIFRVRGPNELDRADPVKLLEINEDTIATGIVPLGFDAVPGAGIPFPSIIIEVTPDEFDRIKTKKLELPKGWRLDQELSRPTDRSRGAG